MRTDMPVYWLPGTRLHRHPNILSIFHTSQERETVRARGHDLIHCFCESKYDDSKLRVAFRCSLSLFFSVSSASHITSHHRSHNASCTACIDYCAGPMENTMEQQLDAYSGNLIIVMQYAYASCCLTCMPSTTYNTMRAYRSRDNQRCFVHERDIRPGP